MRVNLKPLTFLNEDEEIEDESAERVQINYASSGSAVVEFTYDETNDTYSRYNDTEQTVEWEKFKWKNYSRLMLY